MKTKWLMGVLLAAVLLFAGACGSDDDAADNGTSSNGNGDTPTEEASVGDADEGQELFNGTCASCHGKDAEKPTVGKNLRDNEFVKASSEDELVTLVENGRPSSDPLNTTGIDMPPNGGNPSLKDADIHDIVAYVKSLNE